jgi:hypothetical protein
MFVSRMKVKANKDGLAKAAKIDRITKIISKQFYQNAMAF